MPAALAGRHAQPRHPASPGARKPAHGAGASRSHPGPGARLQHRARRRGPGRPPGQGPRARRSTRRHLRRGRRRGFRSPNSLAKVWRIFGARDPADHPPHPHGGVMAKKGKENAVYKVIEIVGTSTQSWADAAKNACNVAGKSLRDLRVAEVDKLDVKIDGGKLIFRAKLKVSFKFHGED